MEEKELAQSLIDTVTNSDLFRIFPDMAEIALDHVLDDGLLKEIPVVQSIVALCCTTEVE